MSEFSIKQATRVIKKPSIVGNKNPHWQGGEIRRKGRVMIYSPNHPFPSETVYVYRYRLVMEKHLGRYLKHDEVIHHKNRIKDDDRLENLQLMTNAGHSQMHGADFLNGKW